MTSGVEWDFEGRFGGCKIYSTPINGLIASRIDKAIVEAELQVANDSGIDGLLDEWQKLDKRIKMLEAECD